MAFGFASPAALIALAMLKSPATALPAGPR